MGVPPLRIMRFIGYMLYIAGDRANPGGIQIRIPFKSVCKPH
jgi:hypothetical protein